MPLFMMALYQIKQKCYVTTVPSGRKNVTLNRPVCLSGQLHKIRTAEMQLIDNGFKFTEELRKEAKAHCVISPEIQ